VRYMYHPPSASNRGNKAEHVLTTLRSFPNGWYSVRRRVGKLQCPVGRIHRWTVPILPTTTKPFRFFASISHVRRSGCNLHSCKLPAQWGRMV